MPTTFDDVDAAAFLRASVSQRRQAHYQGQSRQSTGLAPRRGSLLARIYPLVEDEISVQAAATDDTNSNIVSEVNAASNEDI